MTPHLVHLASSFGAISFELHVLHTPLSSINSFRLFLQQDTHFTMLYLVVIRMSQLTLSLAFLHSLQSFLCPSFESALALNSPSGFVMPQQIHDFKPSAPP